MTLDPDLIVRRFNEVEATNAAWEAALDHFQLTPRWRWLARRHRGQAEKRAFLIALAAFKALNEVQP